MTFVTHIHVHTWEGEELKNYMFCVYLYSPIYLSLHSYVYLNVCVPHILVSLHQVVTH